MTKATPSSKNRDFLLICLLRRGDGDHANQFHSNYLRYLAHLELLFAKALLIFPPRVLSFASVNDVSEGDCVKHSTPSPQSFFFMTFQSQFQSGRLQFQGLPG